MPLEKLLKKNLSELQIRVYKDLIKELSSMYQKWAEEIKSIPVSDRSEPQMVHFADFLVFMIRQQLDNISNYQTDYDEFKARYSKSVTEKERREHIMVHAQKLNKIPSELKEDRKAFNYWFSHDAIGERYMSKIGKEEQKICFCLKRLCANINLFGSSQQFWERLDLDGLIRRIINYNGDKRVLQCGLSFLKNALTVLPGRDRRKFLSNNTFQKSFHFSMDEKLPTAIQAESLWILRIMDKESFIKVIKTKLTKNENNNNNSSIFIRRICIKYIGESLSRHPDIDYFIRLTLKDDSPFVRQELTYTVCKTSDNIFKIYCQYLALKDQSPQVRAMMILQLADLMKQGEKFDFGYKLFYQIIQKEKNEFVLKVTLKAIQDIGISLDKVSKKLLLEWKEKIIPDLEEIQQSSEGLALRRMAAQTKEKLWILSNTDAQKLKEILEPIISKISPGSGMPIARRYLEDYSDQILGRVLSVLAQEDFGLSIKRGRWWVELYRGPEFRFRWWRFFHELFHPSPDKRQGFSHTRGRCFHGYIHAPSTILAELTESKVPGEPLFIDSEQGWRPYLPLLDHIISILKPFSLQKKNQLIFSPDGITEIIPPDKLFKRISAKLKITLKFQKYAHLRNWREYASIRANSYINELEKLGFKIKFNPHPKEKKEELLEDSSVKRFFPVGASFFIPFPNINEILSRIKDYFISIYENSFLELIIFTLLAVIIFLGRHLYLNFRHRKIRHQLPLVIGGWGTRGKSGTERLKAALFNALGLGVVSKTTGSEATFLHAWANGQLFEIPLFRPYEKATIWEQQDVTRMAGLLKADVLLWECMALQPHYVSVLQKNWMQDHYSTITNTYPDHEDIMGPAGINIPEVMKRFIPENAMLFTSEEQMRPILQEGAKSKNSKIKNVGWLEAGLLTPDILERFPYNEHPYNIALVLALAEELDIDKGFALEEMANRVVPEIGMLKTFPLAEINSRTLQFTNGMAANERIGLLSNWQRMGFDKQNPTEEPGVIISTVVNNRADRIPRSQVFAHILVEDISADRHFLIGTNLTGLKGYIEDAWEEYAQSLTLFPEMNQSKSNALISAKQKLIEMTQKMKIPVKDSHIKNRLKIMLNAVLKKIHHDQPTLDSFITLWNQPQRLKEKLINSNIPADLIDSLIQTIEEDINKSKQYNEFLLILESHQSRDYPELDIKFRALLKEWFNKKIIIIWDPHASGNQIIRHIAQITPPGFLNQIMGIQNIKGTGFNFVEEWQAWDHCYKALELIQSDDELDVDKGLNQLGTMSNYGILSEDTVKNIIPAFKSSSMAQNERFQAQLMIIWTQFEKSQQLSHPHSPSGISKKGFFSNILNWVEGLLDAGDAVKRKKKALRIYEDLGHQRISHPRAIQELNKLNKRQKGGWLGIQIRNTLNIFRR